MTSYLRLFCYNKCLNIYNGIKLPFNFISFTNVVNYPLITIALIISFKSYGLVIEKSYPSIILFKKNKT